MTSIVALAATFAFESLHMEDDGSLFSMSEADCSNAPLFCTRELVYTQVPHMACHSELTTKLIKLISLVWSFQFIPRVVAVHGRMCDSDIELLEGCRGLNYVDLNDCIQKPDTFKHLTVENFPLLKKMIVPECDGVNDVSLQMHFPRMRALRDLDISNCSNVTSAGLKAGLAGHPNLRKLSLAGCELLDSSCFPECINLIPRLCELNVSRCRHIKYFGWLENKSISKLDVSGCPFVSIGTIEYFIDALPYLVDFSMLRQSLGPRTTALWALGGGAPDDYEKIDPNQRRDEKGVRYFSQDTPDSRTDYLSKFSKLGFLTRLNISNVFGQRMKGGVDDFVTSVRFEVIAKIRDKW